MKTFLQSFYILTAEDIENFMKHTRRKTLQKGAFFVRENEHCNEVAFIESGLFRSFYHNSNGEEITYCFLSEQSLLTAYSAYITGQRTTENIQALAPSELVYISKSALEELQENNVRWLTVFKTLAEQEYLNLERRIFTLQRESAEQRYLHLLQHHPKYLLEIPLQYLASYLGISQRHLSRIRQQIKN